MSYSPLIDKAVNREKSDGKTLSASEKTYITFRKVVDPGMVDAGFDLIPSKSSDVRQKGTGEKYTDQSLRGHILNGASFGTQFNAALKEIDLRSALEQKDLIKALALFACHDFHKTDGPQIRRLKQERGLRDEDKDLRENEVRELIDSLNLDDLDLDLSFRDYYDSALSTEKMSGRHRQVSSREFDRLKEWVRLMDAAAGMQMPSEATTLERRIRKVSELAHPHYHRIDDTRGISTNILNHAVADYLTTNRGVEEVVYFHDGVIYISNEDYDDNLLSTGEEDETTLVEKALDDILQKFMNTVKGSREDFQKPEELQGFLTTSGVLPKGYLKVNSTSYFLSGIENILGAVKKYLQTKARQDNWNAYSVYNDALLAALASGVIEVQEVPQNHNKTQALGIFAGTVFMELFKPLNDGDTRESLDDLCNALELTKAEEKLLSEYDSSGSLFSLADLSEAEIEKIKASTGLNRAEIEDKSDTLDLHRGGKKSFAQVVAMVFLAGETSKGAQRSELPIEELLEEMEEMFLLYYRGWKDKWDESRDEGWDAEWRTERKREEFEIELQGVLPAASRHYIRSNVTVDGYWFPRVETKDKYKEYAKSNQGHICLLCNGLLIGDSSLDSFESGQDTVGGSLGFSHLKTINASGGEPNTVICPICDLEMTLRNSVHETDPDVSSQFLLVAPDYFYSPIDIWIEKFIREEIYDSGGGELLQASKSLLGSDPSKRSEAMGAVLSFLRQAEEQEEFQNKIKNYDAAFDVEGSVGVYRLDPPRRANDPSRPITRLPQWYLSSYFSVLFSWLTSSRVLLTDTPIPTTQFEDYDEMILIEGAPPPVQRFVGETITISRLSEKKEWIEYEFSHLMKGTGENEASQRKEESGAETKSDPTTRYKLKINTDLAKALYKLSAFTYVGLRVNQFDVQRFASLLSDLEEPFVGANSLLKGNEQIGDYTALRAADILDTLAYAREDGGSSGRVDETNAGREKQGGSEGGFDGSRKNTNIRRVLTMRDRLDKLAQAGFQAVRPNSERDTNHEYERLFRVARDAISGPVTKNASREELIDIISGDVMKAAARARKKNARNDRDRKYASEQYTREPAEEFAQIFVDDVFEGICDGEFYELRRLENRLASGYNAAIRRHLQEWFEKHSD